jgi:hypothetical protein
MALLVGVVAAAFLMSATVASLLLLSTNQARLGFHGARRLQAWYAAEAGVWWAQQQLRNNPALVDNDAAIELTVGGLGVDVRISNEPALPLGSGIKRIVCNVDYTVN